MSPSRKLQFAGRLKAIWEMAENAGPHKGLDDVNAYKAAVKGAPKYTMAPKLPSSNDLKNRLPTEPAARGDLRKEIEATQIAAPPSYSMGAREAGLLPPPKQPGPGEYKLPSTLEQTHPQEVMTGRGFSWGATGRVSMASKNKTPSPQAYRANSEPSLKKAPSYSMGARWKPTTDKEVRPGCQKYKVGKILKDGPEFTPQWTLAERRSEISNTRSGWPGPDKYWPALDSNGRRDRTPKWGLYATDRFKPLKKDREPPY